MELKLNLESSPSTIRRLTFYSNAVKKAKESVKVLEAKEVSEGVAEEKVTQVMSFTANKK